MNGLSSIRKRRKVLRRHLDGEWVGLFFLFFCLTLLDSEGEDNITLVVNGVSTNAGNRLYVGQTGTNNMLSVLNGGVLQDRNGYVGYEIGASNNLAQVQGIGSLWTNRMLTVGQDGASNILRIRTGGGVSASRNVFVGRNASANDNLLRVAGSNSYLRVEGDLAIGFLGASNRMQIANRAFVLDDSSTIGNRSGSDQNRIYVLGLGTLWTNRSNLTLGRKGRENLLSVNDQATLFAERMVVGQYRESSNNTFRVSSNSTAFVSEELTLGQAGSFNRLRVVSASQLFAENSILGESATASENVARTSGRGSVWSNRLDFVVGESGSKNLLEVSDGAKVYSRDLVLGEMDGATENKVRLSGAGSALNLRRSLLVGEGGSEARLLVNTGAVLRVEGSTTVGDEVSSHGNLLRIVGSSAFWTNTSPVVVGAFGSSNTVQILGGATLFAASRVVVGGETNAMGNLINISGSGSRALVQGRISIGGQSGNRINVQNGAFLFSDGGLLGNNGASGTEMLLAGHSTVWTNTGRLTVGDSGSENHFSVTNGAQALLQTVRLGLEEKASKNLFHLSGSESRVWVNGNLNLGVSGGSNHLEVIDSAFLFSQRAYLGRETNSFGNTAFLTGSGTVWSNESTLYLGYQGSGSQLTVSNAARLITSKLYLGLRSISSGNTLSIFDASSLLTENIQIGRNESSGNQIIISGVGSSWSNLSDLVISSGGVSTNNSLVVRKGATLFSAMLSNRGGGSLKITGGSSLSISASSSSNPRGSGIFQMGTSEGGTNYLMVANGGKLASGNSEIGLTWNGGGNVLSVSGSNSLWKANRLVLGKQSSNNRIFIDSQGVVRVEKILIGASNGANNNSITITGNGSLIRASKTLSVGFAGATNNYLSILNNAKVQAASVGVFANSHLSLEDGILDLSGTLTVDDEASVDGWGMIDGNLALLGRMEVGDVGRGRIMQILGNLTLHDTSTLFFDILSLNEYDQVQISRTLSLDGELVVALSASYSPQAGDHFQLFDAVNSSGDFDSMTFSPLPNNLSWDTSKLATEGSVEVVPEPAIMAFLLLASFFGLFMRRFFMRQGILV